MLKKFFLILLVFSCILNVSCKRNPSPYSKRSVRNHKNISKSDNNLAAHSSKYYIVKKKDTLWSISRKFSVSVSYLKRVNNLKDSNILNIGQKLYVGKDSSIKPVKKTQTAIKKNSVNNKKKKLVSSNSVKTSKFLMKPEKVAILYKYGDKKNNIRVEGIEYRSLADQSIIALASGDIVYVDNENTNKIIIIEHKNNFYTVYSDVNSISVKMGDVVREGNIVGNVRKGKVFSLQLRKFVDGSNPIALDPGEFFK